MGLLEPPGATGACREPVRAVRVGLVLGKAGSGVYAEVGHSLYTPSSMAKVSLFILGCLSLRDG